MLTAERAANLIDNVDSAIDRLLEAITRKSIDRTLAPIERQLQSRVAKLWIKQGRDVLAALPKMRKHLIETVEGDFNELFDDAILDTSADMQDAIASGISKGVTIGGKQMIKEFAADIV